MQLKLYNTLTRRKEIFRPFRKDWVGLYTCGPTVYNYAHLGNLRTYIFEDILRRTLEYAGYEVLHVMNITDVEDKIIRDAKQSGKTIFEFVKPYEQAFYEDLKKLGIERAWKYPKATDHIKAMEALIQTLLKKGFAYQIGGSVYFDISKFKKYGRLSRLVRRRLRAGARVSTDEYSKDDARDFALWKAAAPGEPSWRAPFGEGRPGWHIECSAMAIEYLGPTFDIHAGGVDLIFPHHENEIAQSQGATGQPFARFFVEGEHLLVNNERMAKSLGNFFTLRDIEERGYNPVAFRYLGLTAHYRSKLNFTWESLDAAQNSLNRLYDFMRALYSVEYLVLYKKPYSTKYSTVSQSPFKKQFVRAIFNDLDSPKALAVLWSVIRAYNKNPNKFNPREVRKLLLDFDRVLGLGLQKIKAEKIPKKILALVEKRKELRNKQRWAEADRLRAEIEAGGWVVEDTPEGSRVKKFTTASSIQGD